MLVQSKGPWKTFWDTILRLSYGYTDFFIHIPDVVAVNHILCRAAKTPGRVVMMYAGDNHRLGVLRLMIALLF